MPFFEVLNIHQDYQYSLSKLFQKYVADQGKYEIILPERNFELYPKETREETQSKALGMSAPYFIKGDLNALGDLIIVTISMFRTDNGEEIWNSLLKANKLDDLDPILVTFAKNLGEKNVTSTSGDIYNVTEQEEKELREVETKICGGLALGGAYPFGGSLSPGIGGLITYDNRTIIYGVDFVGFSHENNSLAYLDITVDHPFTTEKNTGFAGGGLGYGAMSIEGQDTYSTESNNGLILLGGGGFILNRTASVRLIIGSRIFIPLFKVDNEIRPGINFYLALNVSRKSKRNRR